MPLEADSSSLTLVGLLRPNTRAGKEEDIGSSTHLLDNLAKLLNLFETWHPAFKSGMMAMYVVRM